MNIDQIDRDRVKVVIFTPQYRIEGTIHILPGGRITDFVNVAHADFIAVTQAKVYCAVSKGEEEPLYEKDFLALNKEYIIIISPSEEE